MASRNRHYENVPFEIPDSWEWTTIETLLINRDSERIPLSSAVREKQVNKIYDYYGAAGVIDKVDQYIFSERLLLIGEDGANLLSRIKDNAFFADGKYWVNNHAHVLDCIDKLVLEYVALVINSTPLDNYITGSAQPKLSQDNLNKIQIPLPPLNEQKRIIEAKNQWFSHVDEIEIDKRDLRDAIKQAKSKILSLAISGKLIPQNPNDEPAIELLKRTNTKFASCDTSHYKNMPYEIPDSWVWVKLGDISNYGKCLNVDVEKIGQDDWVIELEDIEKDTARIIQHKTKSDRTIKGTRHKFTKGCVLYSKLRTYLNKVLVPEKDGFCTTEIIPINFVANINPQYMCFVLRSQYFVDYTNQKGYGVKMPRLSTTDAKNGLIPLPPLAEQKRIVKKIKDSFEVIEAIVEEL